ncbi:MAG: hypothetical protein FJY85_15070 [Deltaproteobacteria bacterium]|nr:hypothetical protein [Deltaproteobacteria bacterium]
MNEIVTPQGEDHNGDSSLNVGALSLGTAPELKAADVDVASLALSQDYASLVTVSSQTVGVEITRPSRLEFIRTHPLWLFICAMLEVDFEHWVLAPALFPRYFREAAAKMLVPAITRRGALFLWPIRLPGIDGRIDRWNQTAKHAADLARTKWVRLVSNRKIGDYDIEIAEGIGDPTWPKDVTSMEQLLKLAFVDKVIDSESHPVLLRLAGKD